LSRMRTYYFTIRRGQLIDCNSVPKLYHRSVLLLLYKLQSEGCRAVSELGRRSEAPRTEKVNGLCYKIIHREMLFCFTAQSVNTTELLCGLYEGELTCTPFFR